MIWLLTRTVNEMPEFRTSLTKEGLGIYDSMHPMYTIFNKEHKNDSFSFSFTCKNFGIDEGGMTVHPSRHP
jgi:chloramphenicol O-acetyltransferase